MHQAVQDFIASLKRDKPEWFRDRRVLEVGSYDINGSPRGHFENCAYLGIDRRCGPGVNLVAEISDLWSWQFDVVISTEALEHDPHWRDTLQTMRERCTGLLIVTAAIDPRTPHCVEECGGYYGNIDPDEVLKIMPGPRKWQIDRIGGDLHAAWLVRP